MWADNKEAILRTGPRRDVKLDEKIAAELLKPYAVRTS